MFEKINLALAEKEITGLHCGTGSLPCLIVGPGSFYLQMLSENLKKEFIFFCFDDLWTYEPGGRVKNEQIKAHTFDSLAKQIEQIVFALQKKYGYSKIGLMGFSAPGLLAFKAANALGFENVAYVISSGLATTKLDPSFKATDSYFMKYADAKRTSQLKEDEEEFTKLINSSKNIEPQLLWLLELQKIRTKQLYDYENTALLTKFYQIWNATPDGKILSETMRSHFFGLLQEENPETILKNFMVRGIPTFLSYGQYDFTTPPPSRELREKWGESATILSFFKYSGSVHYPYFEEQSRAKFDIDLIYFTRCATERYRY